MGIVVKFLKRGSLYLVGIHARSTVLSLNLCRDHCADSQSMQGPPTVLSLNPCRVHCCESESTQEPMDRNSLRWLLCQVLISRALWATFEFAQSSLSKVWIYAISIAPSLNPFVRPRRPAWIREESTVQSLTKCSSLNPRWVNSAESDLAATMLIRWTIAKHDRGKM